MARGIGEQLGLQRQLVAVQGCRAIGKRDMVLNDYAPHMEINPKPTRCAPTACC